MRKVLLVDDDEGVRHSLRMLLKQNYEIVFAVDGQDAIIKFAAFRPDLVLLDLCLPGMNGLEVLKSIRTQDPHAVAIIITAYATLESAQDALRLGAFDYLLKPFDLEQLEDIIRRAIEHRIELLHLYLKCEAEQNQTMFLTYVSHELKTPLTPVIGAIDVLDNGILGPLNPKQKQAVELAKRQADRLHTLINDLLDHFKIDNGCLVLNPQPVQLQPLIQESLAYYAPLFANKGLSLKVQIPATLPPALVDPPRFGQIIDNLLENAYKYTATGGVTLKAKARHHCLQIAISDTGDTMDASDIGHIFLPFYQVNSTRRGAGLGLTIVKQLVEAHGGSISAENVPTGKGCTITLELPLALSS